MVQKVTIDNDNRQARTIHAVDTARGRMQVRRKLKIATHIEEVIVWRAREHSDRSPKRQPRPPSRKPIALELSDLRPTDTSQKHGRERAHLLDGAVPLLLLPAVMVDLLVLIVDAVAVLI